MVLFGAHYVIVLIIDSEHHCSAPREDACLFYDLLNYTEVWVASDPDKFLFESFPWQRRRKKFRPCRSSSNIPLTIYLSKTEVFRRDLDISYLAYYLAVCSVVTTYGIHYLHDYLQLRNQTMIYPESKQWDGTRIFDCNDKVSRRHTAFNIFRLKYFSIHTCGVSCFVVDVCIKMSN